MVAPINSADDLAAQTEIGRLACKVTVSRAANKTSGSKPIYATNPLLKRIIV
jgi:hypothetical protein